MPDGWSGFSYIVTNLARFVRPDEVTLSRAHAPARIHLVDTLPENAVGKVDRAALARRIRDRGADL